MHDHPTLSDVIAALNDGENARAEQLLEDLVDLRAAVGRVWISIEHGIKVDPMPSRPGFLRSLIQGERIPGVRHFAWQRSPDAIYTTLPGGQLTVRADVWAQRPRLRFQVEPAQLLLMVTAAQRRPWNHGVQHVLFAARAFGGWDLPTMARPVKVIWPSWGIRR